jgi:hypothetical protein
MMNTGEVAMKKLGAFLAMISLLSLVPAAFAVDNSVTAPTPQDSRLVNSDASHESSNVTRVEDEVWHPGDLRSSGLYMGPDHVLHYVPTQNPHLKLY